VYRMQERNGKMAGGFAHIPAAAEALGKLRDVDGLTGEETMALRQLPPFVEEKCAEVLGVKWLVGLTSINQTASRFG